MIDYTSSTTVKNKSAYNEGLRVYMLSIFKNMGIALIITAITSMFVASSPQLMNLFFNTPLKWVVILSPLIMVFYLGSKIMSMTVQGARTALWSFSALMGISLASLFYVYTEQSLAKVFFITASLFGAMSIYGHTTKRDLSSMGSFLTMGMIGLIIASLANIFFPSPALYNILSYIGVIIFTLLTAYDVQKLKNIYFSIGSSGNEAAQKVAIYGALNLYMDFINLFIFLLRIFGMRRD